MNSAQDGELILGPRSGDGAQFLAYDEEQWDKVEKSVEHLKLDPDNRASLRPRLQAIVHNYLCLLHPNLERIEAAKNRWKRISDLTNELITELWAVKKQVLFPLPDYGMRMPPEHSPFHLAVVRSVHDLHNLYSEACRLASTYSDPRGLGSMVDGLPFKHFRKRRARVWFQFDVFELWIEFGGKLGISRNAFKNQTTGPLARYYSAVAQPVIGGSLESLSSAVKRHRAMQQDFAKWKAERNL